MNPRVCPLKNKFDIFVGKQNHLESLIHEYSELVGGVCLRILRDVFLLSRTRDRSTN